MDISKKLGVAAMATIALTLSTAIHSNVSADIRSVQRCCTGIALGKGTYSRSSREDVHEWRS